MAASSTDKITNTAATTTSRPQATQVTSTRAAGVLTLAGNAFTGWPTSTDSKVHFCTYKLNTSGAKIAGSQIDMEGILSGTSIGSIVIRGGTDVGNAIGDIIEMAPTAAWGYDLYTGMTNEHNRDGTHAAITPTSVTTPSGGITEGAETLLLMRSQYLFNFIASGCVWSGDAYASTRNASMTAGVIFISGKPVAVSAVTARAFTASKDTYIDVDNTGTITYNEQTNNAASPALAANSIRLGIIVTGASNIAAAASVNQGQEDRVLPIASSIPYTVTDSLGNLICPRDPNRKLLGYRQVLVQFNTTNATSTQITGLSVPYIPVSGRKVKVTAGAPQLYANSAAAHRAKFSAWEGTPNVGTLLQSTIGISNLSGASIQGGGLERVYTPSGTSVLTINGGLNSDSAGVQAVVDIDGTGTCIWLRVELE